MKTKKLILALLAFALITAGCGPSADDDWDTGDEESFAYDFEVKSDNYMMGQNFGEQTPRYVFGDIICFDRNETQDVYCVNKSCTPDAIKYYAELCEEKGFRKVSSTFVETNTAESFSNGELVITVMDIPALERVIITAEKAETQDFDSLAVPVKSRDTTATISQIGSDNPGDLYGMGYVIRMTDGRFIVIDGGYRDNSADDWIYSEMQELTPEGEDIVIAAWIITHSHDDHCGAFISFASHYRKKVRLERIFYNFASEHQYLTCGQNYVYDELVRTQAVEMNFPGIRTVNPHICSEYDFGEAKLTYILTAEAMQGDSMASSNSMSTVFYIDIQGQRLLFLADSNTENVPYIDRMYTASTLKCDALQAAHHGYNNANFESKLYEIADPAYAFFPSSTENFECSNVQNGAANNWLFDNLAPEHIIVAGEGVERLELPLK